MNNYKKTNENEYQRDSSDKRSAMPLIIGLLLIVSLLIYYFYQDDVNEKFKELFKTEENSNDTVVVEHIDCIDYVIDDIREIVVEEDTSILYDSKENTSAEFIVERIEEQNHSEETPAPAEEKQKSEKIEVYRKDRKIGFQRISDGQIIIEPQYSLFLDFDRNTPQSYLAVCDMNHKYGVIDLENNIIIPFIYDRIDFNYVKTHWRLQKRVDNIPYYGLLRIADAEIIIPVEYEELTVVKPVSFIVAKKDGKYGCINDKNQVTIPFVYENSPGISRSGSNSNENSVWFTDAEGNMLTYDKNGNRIAD